MIFEHHGVVGGVSDGSCIAFVRVARQRHRRIVAVADGHCYGFISGEVPISGAVLDELDHALARDPAASVESLFDAARAAFSCAAERYPEDVNLGGAAAELTIAELAPGRLRVGRIGRIEVLVVRDGDVHRASGRPTFGFIEREPRAPSIVERPLLDGDLVVVSRQWAGDVACAELAGVVEHLSRAHREPRGLVEAAIVRWKDDVRRKQEAGKLHGDAGLALAAVRV